MLGGSGGGWGLEERLCGPVSGGGHGGAVLGGMRVVSAMALAGVRVYLCVLVLCLFRKLGRGRVGRGLMGWRDFWSFLPSCLLFYLLYVYSSNLPFLSNSFIYGGKNNDKEKRKKKKAL